MSEAEDWTVIVRAKNQEIQKWQQQALELSNLVMPLREEVARLTKALQTIQWLYDVAPNEMAYSIAKAALTPQAGKGGGA